MSNKPRIEYSASYCRPELLKEINNSIESLSDSSLVATRKHALGYCEKGHCWAISMLSSDSCCPICSGKAIQPGRNDFVTLYPEIAAQWHPTKNVGVLISKIRPGSHRKLWWRCEKGHEWQAEVKSRVSGSGCPICSGRIVLKGETDFATLFPILAGEWHPTKNGGLLPNEIRPRSNRKIWWRCEKGHEWQAALSSRVNGYGCPICSGKAVVEGQNDFSSRYPAIAKQWHPQKNGTMKPTMVASQSNRIAWWQDEFGHESRTSIASRVKGSGCPICLNKQLLSGFNDLQTRFPEIAKEWDSEKNGITPGKVLPNNDKAWWRCPYGHEYETTISSRTTKNTGCPICAGKEVAVGVNDLATSYPQLAQEWHPQKNGRLLPTMVTAGSNKRVWWQDEFGHEWMASVVSRTSKDAGCPYCSGRKVSVGFNDLASQEPKIAEQWHPTLNGTRTPEMYTCGSNQKIWWQCNEGHVWQAPIGRRVYQHSGCPVCSGNVSRKKLLKYERMASEARAQQERETRDTF